MDDTTPVKSCSPLTGELFDVPDGSDQEKIVSFLSANKNKRVVVVQGLGFVGFAMSLICSNGEEDFAVIGLDLADEHSYWKIGSINSGRLPVVSSDEKIGEYFRKSRSKGNLMATHDPVCLSYADFILVDVNLDVDHHSVDPKNLNNFSINLENFNLAIQDIAKFCKEDSLILIETTVPPGTCSKVVLPTIHNGLRERGLETTKIKIAHSYERVMPGPNYINSIKNFYRVFSGVDQNSAKEAKFFLDKIISTKDYPLTELPSTEASELAKILENSYRATNIAFIVEWTKASEIIGVNLFEIIEAIKIRPTHSNIMYPNIGVGGYCLTKDSFLAQWALQHSYASDHKLTFSMLGVLQNRTMPMAAYELISQSIQKINLTIGLLGVAYAPDITDTRHSPVSLLKDYLERDHSVYCHDPYVSFWPEKSETVEQNLENFLDRRFDALVFSTCHSNYVISEETINEYLQQHPECLVFDLVGLINRTKFSLAIDSNRIVVLGDGKRGA